MTKTEPIVALLAEEWAVIDALCAGLTDAEWKTPTDLPGWAVQDALSHLIAVERMLLGDPAPDIDVSHLTYVQNDFALSMEVWIEERRDRTGAEVLAEYRGVVERRLAHFDAMSDDDWAQPGWSPIGEVPYRDFMVVRLFDCWMHEQDIRRAIKRPGHLHGDVVDTALVRFTAALGFVVGKKAGAPDGSSVVIVPEGGPPDLTYAVVVDGRARLVDDPPADPTVTITLPFESFVALGGGRWTREQALEHGGIDVIGDIGLGVRVLDALAFTP